MEIKIGAGDGGGDTEVTIVHLKGVKAVFGKMSLVLGALGRTGFYERLNQIHALFTENPSLFIETYEEATRTTLAFRPGVSKIMDRIIEGAAEAGGGYKINTACEELMSFSRKRPASWEIN